MHAKPNRLATHLLWQWRALGGQIRRVEIAGEETLASPRPATPRSDANSCTAKAYNQDAGTREMTPTLPRRSLLSFFDEFLRAGTGVAVVERRGYRRHSTTYSELSARAVACADDLEKHGIGPGGRVLLWGPNSANWIACFWGILQRGAIAVPMDASAAPDFVERAVREARVGAMLHASPSPNIASEVVSINYDEFFSVRRPPRSQQERFVGESCASRETIAQILFTSGTTAQPRGVVLTHGNFLANLEPIERGFAEYEKYERWFHPLRFVSLVPLSHVFGQFMALLVVPLIGGTVVFEPSNQPADIVRAVKSERATALIAVPRMLDILRGGVQRQIEARAKRKKFTRNFEKAEGQKFLRRAWRFRSIHWRLGWKFWAFISGGAALSNETELFFRRLGYAVVQGYGMTETASLISLNHPFRAAEGSVGKILPGREFKLAEDGEILIRGENVSAGYWEAGELKPTGDSGWLHTGDLGEIDGEGSLRFRGRKKSVIVTPAGMNVYPEDLEAALLKQRAIRGCVVVPLESNGNAEPCAVLLASSPDLAPCAIEAANGMLAEYQRIRTWLLWPDVDFPRTPSGKPRLAAIAARVPSLLEAKDAGAIPAGASDASVSAVIRQISPTASGESLNTLSSLDRAELLSALEQRYGVELNETAFAEARTIADVHRLLEQPSIRTDYNYPRWTQRAPVRWFRLGVYYGLVWPATQILAHPRVLGRENLDKVRGPAIVASNHITRRADIGLILAALPLRFRHRLAIAMGGETLQRMTSPPSEWFVLKRWAYQSGYVLVTALFNVFPLPQFSGFRESFRFAGESADRGYSVLIFPEGVVNNSGDGRMAPFQTGIGLLAENLKLPIIPIRLDGVWQMKREGRRLARLGEVTVHIGKPQTFEPTTPPAEIARLLQQIVQSL